MCLGILVAGFRLFFHVGPALFQAFHVSKHQLRFDGFEIGQRIDLACHVGHVIIDKATQHINNRIHLADIGQELVAKPLTLARAFHQAGNVYKAHTCGNDTCRTGNGSKLFKAWLGHSHIAHIRLDRAKRIVSRLRGCRLRQRVEQRRLAHVGQTDNTAFEAHGRPLSEKRITRLAWG